MPNALAMRRRLCLRAPAIDKTHPCHAMLSSSSHLLMAENLKRMAARWNKTGMDACERRPAATRTWHTTLWPTAPITVMVKRKSAISDNPAWRQCGTYWGSHRHAGWLIRPRTRHAMSRSRRSPNKVDICSTHRCHENEIRTCVRPSCNKKAKKHHAKPPPRFSKKTLLRLFYSSIACPCISIACLSLMFSVLRSLYIFLSSAGLFTSGLDSHHVWICGLRKIYP